LPPDPNAVSSTPLLRRRATQKRSGAVVSLAVLPATTILPLGWIRTTFAASAPPKLIVLLPSPEKLVSRSPGLAMRRPYPRMGRRHTLAASTRLSAVLPAALASAAETTRPTPEASAGPCMQGGGLI
jgi:hypothetical protein